MRLVRPFLPVLALFLIGLAPSCKKSTEAETSDVVQSDSSEKAEKTSEKKSKKTKAKKKKVEPTEDPESGSNDLGDSPKEKSARGAKGEDKAEPKGDEKSEERTARGSAARLAKKNAEAKASDAAGAKGAAENPEENAEDKGENSAKTPEVVHSAPPNTAPETQPDVATPPASRVGVARLLTNTDLNAQLPMKGWAAHGPVPGIAPSEFYNSILYKIPNTSAFVAIQVWDYETPSLSLEKWNEVQTTFPNVEAYAEGFIKDALYSYRNQVKTFAFYEPKLAMVVSVSCYVQACEDAALYQISELVFSRISTK